MPVVSIRWHVSFVGEIHRILFWIATLVWWTVNPFFLTLSRAMCFSPAGLFFWCHRPTRGKDPLEDQAKECLHRMCLRRWDRAGWRTARRSAWRRWWRRDCTCCSRWAPTPSQWEATRPTTSTGSSSGSRWDGQFVWRWTLLFCQGHITRSQRLACRTSGLFGIFLLVLTSWCEDDSFPPPPHCCFCCRWITKNGHGATFCSVFLLACLRNHLCVLGPFAWLAVQNNGDLPTAALPHTTQLFEEYTNVW